MSVDGMVVFFFGVPVISAVAFLIALVCLIVIKQRNCRDDALSVARLRKPPRRQAVSDTNNYFPQNISAATNRCVTFYSDCAFIMIRTAFRQRSGPTVLTLQKG